LDLPFFPSIAASTLLLLPFLFLPYPEVHFVLFFFLPSRVDLLSFPRGKLWNSAALPSLFPPRFTRSIFPFPLGRGDAVITPVLLLFQQEARRPSAIFCGMKVFFLLEEAGSVLFLLLLPPFPARRLPFLCPSSPFFFSLAFLPFLFLSFSFRGHGSVWSAFGFRLKRTRI